MKAEENQPSMENMWAKSGATGFLFSTSVFVESDFNIKYSGTTFFSFACLLSFIFASTTMALLEGREEIENDAFIYNIAGSQNVKEKKFNQSLEYSLQVSNRAKNI